MRWKSGDFKPFEFPIHLILGKSLVGGSVTGDVFEGISDRPAASARVRGYEAQAPAGLSLEIGDPWRFYSSFWKAHDLDQLALMIPVAEVSAKFGDKLSIPMFVCNRSRDAAEVTINSTLPAGWADKTAYARYPVRAGECYPTPRGRLPRPPRATPRGRR